MGRRTSLIGVLVTSHARAVREQKARERHRIAQARRHEQARAAAARALAAEHRAVEASHRAAAAQDARLAKSRERAEKDAERARARDEKEAERQAHIDAQESAEERTLELQDQVSELQSVLSRTLNVDDRIDFDSLRIDEPPPSFLKPKLSLPAYVPDRDLVDPPKPASLEALTAAKVRPASFFERLFRSTRVARETAAVAKAHAEAMSDFEKASALVARRRREHRADYDRACASLTDEHLRRVEDAREAHDREVEAHTEKRRQRDAEVTALEQAYARGDVESVVLYNEMVLARSDYPAGFPDLRRAAYQPESRQLVIDFELPTASIVPAVAEYRYVKARRAIEEKPRKPADIKAIYRELVAQVALRTIHEVLEADQGNHIDAVVFSGYINKIDATTGLDTRPYLVSVRTTKEAFLAINLARVEPQACLKNLGANVSASPEEARAVRPVVEFDMVDPRFIGETDVLSQLDARPNLMELTPSEFEGLVGNLFTQMGLETKLTRSSRDGGVDAIAFDTRPILGGKVVIQAKRYRHTVGVSAVRDLYGTMLNEGASKGIIVTTSGFGPDAYAFANEKPLEMIDGGGLLYLLESVGRPARIIMPSDV
ncbi:restriction endonuclease [Chiayiivirga flava]|uniref:Restriction system protein n=1 Tax=Chiayiivirga flava TaxID=659595 RepID=A0A7W8D5L7_9GAMM|nr:restriction endonuclease [Chiayiivirga flava]MBB5208364.1 restriction system protein [Chiayiivirga flava]